MLLDFRLHYDYAYVLFVKLFNCLLTVNIFMILILLVDCTFIRSIFIFEDISEKK